MNEFLQQFLLESRELAEAASAGLMALEQSPGNAERLDEVFRAFHTLKGGAGIVGFAALERAAHAVEDLLADARAGRRPLTPASIGRCLACLDQTAEWLDIIERTGELPEVADGHCHGIALPAAPAPAKIPGAGPEESASSLPPHVAAVIEAQQALLAEGPPESLAGRIASAGLVAANALRFCRRIELSERLSQATEQSLLALSAQPLLQALGQSLHSEAGAAVAMRAEPAQPEVAARTLRIDAQQIDALVRLAGELTVVKNAIGHAVKLARSGDDSLADLLQERHGALEHLVGELQRCVLRMRVRPLSAVLRRFPRLVREMAATLDKSVRLVIEGDETEADKAIVEMLFEPLLHLVRNAIDHGVERAPQRTAAGKPATATLRIRGQRLGDEVLIEVSDDGAGIDLARVREVAVKRGLITEEQRLEMTEAEALELIFTPAFSTTDRVTQVSGRGVGMDAVRRAVERIGGHVAVASLPGKGTDVKLSVPFSVMLTHVMTVEAGGQMFGLPLEAIIETVRVPQAAISSIGTTPAIVLRNRALPLIDLGTALGVETSRTVEDGATVVVAAVNGGWGAFRVDRIVERLDLILKPLEGLLAGTPGILGTTLLGDGRVLLVLDIAEMLQ